jgi:LPS sulfotransferase NodH
MSCSTIRVLHGSAGAEKTTQYRRDPAAQRVLWEMNRRLQSLEGELAEEHKDFPDPQLVFITYVPRSGSTILSQILARTGGFNYISNFQARYWLAPYVGGVLEKNVQARHCRDVPLQSDYGITPTTSSPSEFSYFWEHWLQLTAADTHTLDDAQWSRVDLPSLRRQVQLIGSLRPEPLFFKKEWLGMNAGHFLRAFPTLKILHVRRNALEIANSIARARRSVYGSVDYWWAARPANYWQLIDLPWADQIAGQIHGILEDTARWETTYADRFLSVSYEKLVTDTHHAIQQIAEFLEIDLGVDDIPTDLERLPLHQSPDSEPLRRALSEYGLLAENGK